MNKQKIINDYRCHIVAHKRIGAQSQYMHPIPTKLYGDGGLIMKPCVIQPSLSKFSYPYTLEVIYASIPTVSISPWMEQRENSIWK